MSHNLREFVPGVVQKTNIKAKFGGQRGATSLLAGVMGALESF